MSLRSKLRSDAGAAERAMRQKKAQLQRKARQDLKKARQQAKKVSRDDIKAAASQVGGSAGDPGEIESDADGIGDRAYRAGQAPSVVDASLDPSPSGAGMQLFASDAGAMDEGFIGGGIQRPRRERGGQPPREPPSDDRPSGGDDFGFFDGLDGAEDGDSDSALAFDDPLGVGGGWF